MSIELTRAATAEEVRAVFRAAREREEGAEGAPVAMTEAPVIVSAAVAAGATETDPATRALDALLARLEQVATARAEAQAQAQTEAGLRELRTRVLEGITL